MSKKTNSDGAVTEEVKAEALEPQPDALAATAADTDAQPPKPSELPAIDVLRAQGLSAVGIPVDKYHDKGGTFVIRNGKRVPR